MKRLLSLVLFVSACTGSGQVNYSAQVTTPEMVYIEDDVQVVRDYDQPVFYTESYYWRYDNGVWYRSNNHVRGWVRVDVVPVRLRRIDRPTAYVHYRGEGRVHARRDDDHRDHAQPQPQPQPQPPPQPPPAYIPPRDEKAERKDVREDQKDARKDLKQEQKEERKELREDQKDIRRDVRDVPKDVRKDIKEDQRDQRKEQKQEQKEERKEQKQEQKEQKEQRKDQKKGR